MCLHMGRPHRAFWFRGDCARGTPLCVYFFHARPPELACKSVLGSCTPAGMYVVSACLPILCECPANIKTPASSISWYGLHPQSASCVDILRHGILVGVIRFIIINFPLGGCCCLLLREALRLLLLGEPLRIRPITRIVLRGALF